MMVRTTLSNECLKMVDPQQYVADHPLVRRIRELYWGNDLDWELARQCLENMVSWIQCLPLLSNEPFQRPYGAIDASIGIVYEMIPVLKNRMLFFNLPIVDRQNQIRRVKWAYFVTACCSVLRTIMTSVTIRTTDGSLFSFQYSLEKWLSEHRNQNKILDRRQACDQLDVEFWVIRALNQIVPSEIWIELASSHDKGMLAAVKATVEGRISEAKSLNVGLVEALIVAERKLLHKELIGTLSSTSSEFTSCHVWMICDAIADLFADDLCLDTEKGQQQSSRLVTTRDGKIFLDKSGFFDLLSRKVAQKFIKTKWTPNDCLRIAFGGGVVSLDNEAFWEIPFYVDIERRGRTDLSAEIKPSVLLTSPRMFITKGSRWEKLLEKIGIEKQEGPISSSIGRFPTESEWMAHEGILAELEADKNVTEDLKLVERGREGFFQRIRQSLSTWLTKADSTSVATGDSAPVVAERLKIQNQRREQKQLENKTQFKSDFELGTDSDFFDKECVLENKNSEHQQDLFVSEIESLMSEKLKDNSLESSLPGVEELLKEIDHLSREEDDLETLEDSSSENSVNIDPEATKKLSKVEGSDGLANEKPIVKRGRRGARTSKQTKPRGNKTAKHIQEGELF